MFKRARAFDCNHCPDVGPEIAQTRQNHGADLYQWLLGKYVAGEKDGCECCTIAWFHSMSGGVGLEKLALKPDVASRHGNEHARLVFGKDWSDPDLFYCKTYLYDKHACQRVERKIPIRLPSHTLEEDFDPNITVEKDKDA
eukprot:8284145-Karenia_brevis.AAC.1